MEEMSGKMNIKKCIHIRISMKEGLLSLLAYGARDVYFYDSYGNLKPTDEIIKMELEWQSNFINTIVQKHLADVHDRRVAAEQSKNNDNIGISKDDDAASKDNDVAKG